MRRTYFDLIGGVGHSELDSAQAADAHLVFSHPKGAGNLDQLPSLPEALCLLQHVLPDEYLDRAVQESQGGDGERLLLAGESLDYVGYLANERELLAAHGRIEIRQEPYRLGARPVDGHA